LKFVSGTWTPTTVSSFPPSGSAGGDLGGSYPNPNVIALRGNAVKNQSLGAGQNNYVLTWINTSSQWQAQPSTSGSSFDPFLLMGG